MTSGSPYCDTTERLRETPQRPQGMGEKNYNLWGPAKLGSGCDADAHKTKQHLGDQYTLLLPHCKSDKILSVKVVHIFILKRTLVADF